MCIARLIRTAAILAALPTALVACARQPQETILVATGEYRPYTTERDNDYGTASQILTAILQQMGYSPSYVFMPFAQAERTAEQGESRTGIRGTFPYAREPSRLERFYYSAQPLIEVEQVILYNESKTPDLASVTALSALQGRHVLFVEGYRYPEPLERQLGRPAAAATATDAEGCPVFGDRDAAEVASEYLAIYCLVNDGQTDIVPIVSAVGQTIIEDYFPNARFDLRAIPALSWPYRLHFLLTRRNPANFRFMREFDDAHARLIEAGVPQAILRNSRTGIQATTVRLSPSGDERMILAVDPNDERTLVLPRGTRAEVLEWSAMLLARDTAVADDAAGLTKVRLLNGPLRGRVLLVEDEYIEIP